MISKRAEPHQSVEISKKLFSKESKFIYTFSFRWDFLEAHLHNLTAFAYLRKHGVPIPSVTPVFPPEDYPVWTSLATGKKIFH